MSQVIEHAHEQHQVKPLAERRHLINRKLPQLDVHAADFRGKTGLGQIFRIKINPDYPRCPAALHFDGVEAGIAPNIEHGFAAKIGWKSIGKLAPFHLGIIAQEMIGRSPHALQIQIMEPLSQLAHATLDFLGRQDRLFHRCPSPFLPGPAKA